MITRIFHQIWLGPDPLPDEFQWCRRTWARLHPDWELRLWGEDNLPPDLRHREVYDRERPPAERSDIARLELVWRYGGVYLDVDFECRRRIDGLLEGVEFFAGLQKADRVNNALFGSAPGHPILAKALETLSVQSIGKPFDKSKSGSYFFSDLVIGAPGVDLFPPEYFHPATPAQRLEAYAVHRMARSWKDKEGWRIAALKAEERCDQLTAKIEKEQRSHERTKRKLERLEERFAKITANAAKSAATGVAKGAKHNPEKVNILFVLRGIHYDRMFENFLRALLERGHHVHVALVLERGHRVRAPHVLEKRGYRVLDDENNKRFEEFRERYSFSYEQLEPRNELWLPFVRALRHSIDYLRYLDPVFDTAGPLRERARLRASSAVRAIISVPPFRTPAGRRFVARVLRALDNAAPLPKSVVALIEARDPDVVLVSPLVGLGSVEIDYMRAAQRAGIPTVLPVASWDNLTSKGLVYDVPTATIVWNEVQVEEAARLHGIPRARVFAVGAHSWDHWFSWRPSSTREGFAARFGFDPSKKFVLYLGSSTFITQDETPFVREWITALRAHPRLRDVGVLFRPHPQNTRGWTELDIDEPGLTAFSSRTGVSPRTDDAKREYFDSLYHSAAVVGINTSAMIEGAILQRPVLSPADGRFAGQAGNLHFSYIAGDPESSPVVVGRSIDEHLDQLADALESPERHHRRAEEFVATFVRPRGAEIAAAPFAADAVEWAAVEPVPAMPRPRLQIILRLLAPVICGVPFLLHPQRTRRQALKAGKKYLREWSASRLREERTRRAFGLLPARQPTYANEREAARAQKDRARALKEKARAQKERAKRRRQRRAALRALFVPRRFLKALRSQRRLHALLDRRYRKTYTSTISRVPSKYEIAALLNARGLNGRGVHVGLTPAGYPEFLLRNWHGTHLVSIDPSVVGSGESQGEIETIHLDAKLHLSQFGERSEVWRMPPIEAAACVADASLDFVYIRSGEDVETVGEELAAWYPKVKPGGILAGHDDAAVKRAVREFFGARGISVSTTNGPSAVEPCASWLVEIPEVERLERLEQPAVAVA